jgi:hypothetical protein
MKELAIIERYIFGILKTRADVYGWKAEIAPFDVPPPDSHLPIIVPALYFRFVSTGDQNSIGTGPRLLSWADYEIGVFHASNTFGASLKTTGAAVPLLTVLTFIDDAFQNYTPPIVQPSDGTIYSSERLWAVRVPERGPDGKIYNRDGGVYRFIVEAT